MKATGRVNNPTRRNRPPNVSRMLAMPASDMIGAVPPPGMMAAGNANSLAVPNCMNRNAATIRRTLSRYGARVGHFAPMPGAVMMCVSLSVLLVEGDPTPVDSHEPPRDPRPGDKGGRHAGVDGDPNEEVRDAPRSTS